jgi:thioredoxin-related protein
MKIFMTLIALVYSLMAIDAESAAMELDYSDNYQTALAKAKKENKKLMLVVVQDPCPYCGKLVNNTLLDPAVGKALEGYVGVIIDKKGKLPKQFHTSMVPMTFFIDPKTEKSAWESLGYAKKANFLEDIKQANRLLK